MSNPREPHEHNYVDSEGGAAEDEEQPRVVPIPKGAEPGTWRPALRQYLMSLDSPRTRLNYEKSVHYFFGWPEVPEYLDELTYELLNQYQHVLKRRCDPTYQAPTRTAKPPRYAADSRIGASTALVPVRATPLDAEEEEEQWRAAGDQGDRYSNGRTQSLTGPLAPKTVASKICGLRGFLLYCIRHHYLSRLTSDQIRDALKPPAGTVLHEHEVIWEWEWPEWLDCVGTPVLINAGDRRGYLVRGPLQRAARRRFAQSSKRKRPSDWDEQMNRSRWMGKHTGERDVLIVRLLLISLVRNAELRSLNIGSLKCRRDRDGSEHWSLHLAASQTKGRRAERDLPLPLDWVRDYGAYLAATGRQLTHVASPLFVTAHTVDPDPADHGAREGRLGSSTIDAIFLRANITWQQRHPTDPREFSAHGMRRSGATALRNGNMELDPPRHPMPIEMVSAMLGHLHIETTIRYLASGDSLKERAAYVLNPTRSPQQQPHSVSDGSAASPDSA